jgi:nucleoid-associated protein Lsr2
MAQKVTVALEDDLDGGPADESVRFGLGGAEYEIDLSKKNARGRCCVKRFLSSVGALSGCSGQIASASSSKITRSLQRSRTSVAMS